MTVIAEVLDAQGYFVHTFSAFVPRGGNVQQVLLEQVDITLKEGDSIKVVLIK
jgi:butyrate kinase